MATNQSLLATRGAYDSNELIFTTDGIVVVHDLMTSPVFVPKQNTAGALDFPTTSFGAGILTKDDGIKFEDEVEKSGIEGAGYAGTVKDTTSSRTSTLTVGYLEDLKLEIQRVLYGQTLTDEVRDGVVGDIVTGSGSTSGLRTYAAWWMDTPQGVWWKLVVFPYCTGKSLPGFEVAENGAAVTNLIEWDAKADPKEGYAQARYQGGPGFTTPLAGGKSRAELLGYKLATA